MGAVLWGAAGLGDAGARKMLRGFAARALLIVEAGQITFHDLQGDYLRLVSGDLPALREVPVAEGRGRDAPAGGPGAAAQHPVAGVEEHL